MSRAVRASGDEGAERPSTVSVQEATFSGPGWGWDRIAPDAYEACGHNLRECGRIQHGSTVVPIRQADKE